MKYKKSIALVVAATLLFSSSLWAGPGPGPRQGGGAASFRSMSTMQTTTTPSSKIYDSFESLTKLITAASYLAGLGFAVGAIMKFKMHKDDPKQMPVGQPLGLILIAGTLYFTSSVSGNEAVAKIGPYGTIEPY